MKKICLLGAVDKRAVSYPLLKCLMFLGKVLVVTDDGVYRRFADEYESRFSFENSEFIVTPVIDEEVQKEVDSISHSYDYVVYITTNEIPSGCDKIIYFRGVEKSIASKGTLKVLENMEYKEVYITFSKLQDSSALKIEPSKSVMSYVFECEDKKEFVPTKDAGFASMLFTFFEKELDIPKASIKKLLLRG